MRFLTLFVAEMGCFHFNILMIIIDTLPDPNLLSQQFNLALNIFIFGVGIGDVEGGEGG